MVLANNITESISKLRNPNRGTILRRAAVIRREWSPNERHFRASLAHSKQLSLFTFSSSVDFVDPT
jgi:hypothetical protein